MPFKQCKQKHLLQRCHPSSVWTKATHNSCDIIIFRYFPRWHCHKLGALEKTPIPEAFNPAPLGVGRTSSRWLVRCSCGCCLEDGLRGSNVMETKSNQSTVTQSEWHMTSQSKRWNMEHVESDTWTSSKPCKGSQLWKSKPSCTLKWFPPKGSWGQQ